MRLYCLTVRCDAVLADLEFLSPVVITLSAGIPMPRISSQTNLPGCSSSSSFQAEVFCPESAGRGTGWHRLRRSGVAFNGYTSKRSVVPDTTHLDSRANSATPPLLFHPNHSGTKHRLEMNVH